MEGQEFVPTEEGKRRLEAAIGEGRRKGLRDFLVSLVPVFGCAFVGFALWGLWGALGVLFLIALAVGMFQVGKEYMNSKHE